MTIASTNRDPIHLVTFKVMGRAVPWSVPDVGRDSRGRVWALKEKRLKSWQATIAAEARIAWGFRRDPYSAPVGLSFWFYVHHPTKYERTSDITNLQKAAEDSLQGVVIRNDTNVIASHAERYFVDRTEPQRLFVEVWAMPTEIEPTEPGPYAYRPWQWVYQTATI